MKADEGKHGHDDHDQPDQIDYAVHSILPANDTARVQLFRHLNGEAWAFLAEVSGSHQYGSANKNHEHRTHENAQNAACAATTISHDRLPKALDRDSPDDSRTGGEYWRFTALPQDRREVPTLTGRSGSPNGGRAADLAIFAGIWTHSSRR